MSDTGKIFTIINFSNFGDVLLTNTLCQNIRLTYPNSKIIFITNTPFVEAAKYQKDVDEVYGFDKRGKNKGLSGLLKFAKHFPYRNKIFASFVVYGNDRGILLSYLLRAKHRISHPTPIVKYLLTDILEDTHYEQMKDINAELLEPLTHKKSQILPLKIDKPNISCSIASNLKKYSNKNKIIALTLTSSKTSKDMPVSVATELISKLKERNYTVLLLGLGNISKSYSKKLKEDGCFDYIDLIDTTSISDLIDVLKISSALISVDTGTLHLGNAVGIPTVSIFYETDTLNKWRPNPSLYNNGLIIDDYSISNILDNLDIVMEQNKQTDNTNCLVTEEIKL